MLTAHERCHPFWRDSFGDVHPARQEPTFLVAVDSLAGWDDFLARVGVSEGQRNTKSDIEDRTGTHLGRSASGCRRTKW